MVTPPHKETERDRARRTMLVKARAEIAGRDSFTYRPREVVDAAAVFLVDTLLEDDYATTAAAWCHGLIALDLSAAGEVVVLPIYSRTRRRVSDVSPFLLGGTP